MSLHPNLSPKSLKRLLPNLSLECLKCLPSPDPMPAWPTLERPEGLCLDPKNLQLKCLQCLQPNLSLSLQCLQPKVWSPIPTMFQSNHQRLHKTILLPLSHSKPPGRHALSALQ